jgi:hypothetical protein
MSKFYFYSDPSHGWLAVTRNDIKDVGLTISDFTQYSYYRGDVLYLEEDCDAGVFLDAWKRKHSAEPEILDRYSNYDHFIRSYARLAGRS